MGDEGWGGEHGARVARLCKRACLAAPHGQLRARPAGPVPRAPRLVEVSRQYELDAAKGRGAAAHAPRQRLQRVKQAPVHHGYLGGRGEGGGVTS